MTVITVEPEEAKAQIIGFEDPPVYAAETVPLKKGEEKEKRVRDTVIVAGPIPGEKPKTTTLKEVDGAPVRAKETPQPTPTAPITGKEGLNEINAPLKAGRQAPGKIEEEEVGVKARVQKEADSVKITNSRQPEGAKIIATKKVGLEEVPGLRREYFKEPRAGDAGDYVDVAAARRAQRLPAAVANGTNAQPAQQIQTPRARGQVAGQASQQPMVPTLQRNIRLVNPQDVDGNSNEPDGATATRASRAPVLGTVPSERVRYFAKQFQQEQVPQQEQGRLESGHPATAPPQAPASAVPAIEAVKSGVEHSMSIQSFAPCDQS